MQATELIEELARRVSEFGDGDVVLPDALEAWWYPVCRIDFDVSQQRYQLVPNE